MNALAIATSGHISPPLQAMQMCLAARRGLVKPVGVKVCLVPEVQVRIATPVCDRPPPVEAPPSLPKPKVALKATAQRQKIALVSIKQTSPAPSDGPGTTMPAKPTVKVKKNGNGKRLPKLTMKKKLT